MREGILTMHHVVGCLLSERADTLRGPRRPYSVMACAGLGPVAA